jgi:hypothetical protein
MDDATDDAAIVLALRPGMDYRRCGPIAAHCSSLSQKSSVKPSLTGLNQRPDLQLNPVQSLGRVVI